MGRWSPGVELRRLTLFGGRHCVPLLVRIRHGCYLDCMSSTSRYVEPGICGSTGVRDPCGQAEWRLRLKCSCECRCERFSRACCPGGNNKACDMVVVVAKG